MRGECKGKESSQLKRDGNSFPSVCVTSILARKKYSAN